MKRLLGFAVLLLGVTLVVPAVSESAMVRGKSYVVGGINAGAQNAWSAEEGASDVTLSNMGVGIQIMYGYNFTDNIALEVGYSGSNFASQVQVDGEAIDGDYMYVHEIMPRVVFRTNNPELDFYGFVGGGVGIFQYQTTTFGVTNSEMYAGPGGTLGGGLLYHFDNGWFIGGEGSYGQYFVDVSDEGSEESNNVYVNRFFATFRFGFQFL